MNEREKFLMHIEEHLTVIHRLCRVYRDTPADRDDLFQDILIQLWKAWPQFRGDSSVLTWIYRIALSTSIAKFRSPRQRLWKRFGSIDRDQVDPKSGSSTDKEDRQQLMWAIGQLSPVEKGVVALYLDDLSYQEMADVLGITANAVGVKMHRIRDKLKKILKRKQQ